MPVHHSEVKLSRESAALKRGAGRSSLNLQAVLARLEAVRGSGGGWMPRCPAHEDRKPSLSISEGEQSILLLCHAGGDPAKMRAVISAAEWLRLQLRSLSA